MKSTRQTGRSTLTQRAARKAKAGRPSGRRVERGLRIPAGEFKATCLRVMDRVKETGEEVVITKRGRAVAKLSPVTDADLRPFVGRSRGVITASRESLLAPLGEDWDVDADH